MRPAKVAIFDSGIGGLSIAAIIHNLLPNTELHYLCDNKNFPYGSKADKEVVDSTVSALSCLIPRRTVPDIIIIACNTASTVALEYVRSQFKMPIIGVVPAIKPASRLTKTGRIGLLATPMTVRRLYTDQLINDNAAGIEVLRIGSSRLVDLAEEKLRGGPIDREVVAPELGGLQQAALDPNPVDIVVLGCTHFPWLLSELKGVLPGPVTFVDSGMAITRRCAQILSTKELLHEVDAHHCRERQYPGHLLALQPWQNASEGSAFERFSEQRINEQRIVSEKIVTDTLSNKAKKSSTQNLGTFYCTSKWEANEYFDRLLGSLGFRELVVID